MLPFNMDLTVSLTCISVGRDALSSCILLLPTGATHTCSLSTGCCRLMMNTDLSSSARDMSSALKCGSRSVSQTHSEQISPVSQSASHSFSHSLSYSVSQLSKSVQSVCQSASQPVSQPLSQSVIQQISQSAQSFTNHSTSHPFAPSTRNNRHSSRRDRIASSSLQHHGRPRSLYSTQSC